MVSGRPGPWSGRLDGWPVSSRDPSILPSHLTLTVSQAHDTTAGFFYCWFWGLNLSPSNCKASVFLTEPSSQIPSLLCIVSGTVRAPALPPTHLDFGMSLLIAFPRLNLSLLQFQHFYMEKGNK